MTTTTQRRHAMRECGQVWDSPTVGALSHGDSRSGARVSGAGGIVGKAPCAAHGRTRAHARARSIPPIPLPHSDQYTSPILSTCAETAEYRHESSLHHYAHAKTWNLHAKDRPPSAIFLCASFYPPGVVGGSVADVEHLAEVVS